jgi:hypothetical protein
MIVNLDKHDITMICEALEYMAYEVAKSESKGELVAYNRDDIESLIEFLDSDEEEE